MAILIPTIDKILKFKVKAEVGELSLLRFLEKTLDDSFEVYFNPYMNGDRPDIIIVRKNYGVMIVEVKDWNLNLYELDEKKHWKLKNESYVLKSPIDQVLIYKKNLFELHIDTLLEKKIKNIRMFNIVTCAVYFHNANESQVKNLLVDPYVNDRKYQDFLKYNIDLIGRNNLNELDLNKIFKSRYLKADKESILFTIDLYNRIKRFLNPPIHMKEEGIDFQYSKKQYEIIYEQKKKQQRIKGVVGSGKTTILAARAIQAYKRISKNNPDAQILILTYNITIKNFIHDKISKVREEFPWKVFVISNYHQFINSQLNNLGIPFDKDKIENLENNYYSNKNLFLEHKSQIETYDAIFIDEIQDYKRPWMEIIKDCFLSENGEYVLFGDVKQNIYNNPTLHKDVRTNVLGGVIELKRCFRFDFKIKDLAIEYQKNIFKTKYETDIFQETNKQYELQLEHKKEGYINYIYLSDTDGISTLYTIINDNNINKNSDVSPNDITVLGYTTKLLQRLEVYYRYMSREKTTTMFETYEMMYMINFNFFKKNKEPEWLNEFIKLIKRDKDKKRDNGLAELAELFTIYDLYKKYENRFQDKMSRYCDKYNCTLDLFVKIADKYFKELTQFRKEVYDTGYKKIRDYKKIHFWMNSGTIKFSTINSFKGWESEVLFLIIEKKYDSNNDFNISFDELLYTGLTRCRSNLIVINLGNKEYHNKIKPLIDKLK